MGELLINIALCLSGEARFWWVTSLTQYCTELDNLFVFFHTWNNNWIYKEKEFIQYISPTKYLIEDYNKQYYDDIYKRFERYDRRINTIPMYYSIFKSNQIMREWIKETNTKIDVVIRSRFDIKLKNRIEYENLYCINIPKLSDYRGYSDLFAYGNLENMNYYAETYNYVMEPIKQKREEYQLLDPEFQLRQHLNRKPEIKINRFDCELEIVRN